MYRFVYLHMYACIVVSNATTPVLPNSGWVHAARLHAALLFLPYLTRHFFNSTVPFIERKLITARL